MSENFLIRFPPCRVIRYLTLREREIDGDGYLLPLARSAVSARFEPDRFFLRALRLIKIAPSVALVRARLFIRRSNAERIIWSGD